MRGPRHYLCGKSKTIIRMKNDNLPYPTYKCAVSDRAFRKFINMYAYLLSNVEPGPESAEIMNAVIHFLVTGTVGDVNSRIMPVFEHYLPLMEKAVRQAATARAAAARRKNRDKQPAGENPAKERQSEETAAKEPERKFTPGSPIEPIPLTDFSLDTRGYLCIPVKGLPRFEWPKVPEGLEDDPDRVLPPKTAAKGPAISGRNLRSKTP